MVRNALDVGLVGAGDVRSAASAGRVTVHASVFVILVKGNESREGRWYRHSFIMCMLPPLFFVEGFCLDAISSVDVPSAASSGRVHHNGRTSGARTRSGNVSGTTTSRGMLYRMELGFGYGLGECKRYAHDGGCLCVFLDELSLVLGLCCILGGAVGVSGRRADISSTTASDGKELIIECK